jgi:predicted DNA-binding protein (MmcQ/YjbR family)
VIRHRENKKVFAWIFDKDGHVWINLKTDPEWRDFWRQTYASVLPAYHLNKEHWTSVILDGTVPDKDIKRLIGESYDLTKKQKCKRKNDEKP